MGQTRADIVFTSATIEKIAPYIWGVVLTVAYIAIGAPLPPSTAYAAVLGAAAGASAIFVGFLSATKAVILGASASKAYLALRTSGFLSTLFGYIKSAIYSSIALAVFSIFLMFFDPEKPIGFEVCILEIYNVVFIPWVFLSALSVLTLLRVSKLLFRLLDQV
ncbi:putative membrane protein YphA (DoxX/SURF4 family) [Rhizobium sp. SLBN-94]|nr:putative membrane protein YphA (DoxX/SURF4 family) [Rhizobium sp. SLBN-94]